MSDPLILLHIKLVHFPIALFVSALVLDVLSRIFHRDNLHTAAVVVYVGAAVFTPVVLGTGLFEKARLHLNHPVLAHHELCASITMWFALLSLPVLLILKKRSTAAFRAIFTLVLVVAAGTVVVTGYYGGSLVYEYGVGVSR